MPFPLNSQEGNESPCNNVRTKRTMRAKSYVPACQFLADRGRSASVSLGMGRLRPVAGDVVCKFSKLLNQEDALGAPCLQHFRKTSLPRPGAAFYKRWSGVSVRLFKGAFSFLSAHLHAP